VKREHTGTSQEKHLIAPPAELTAEQVTVLSQNRRHYEWKNLPDYTTTTMR